jgi:DNA-binding NarL/FixJ family response regulator
MKERIMQRDTVLVVDDAPDSLGFLTEALERAGFAVLVATDGASALAVLDDVTPDLILMDAVMPGLDGFETTRRLRCDRHAAHVPVVFMTGLSESEHVVKGLEAGGVDYVTKPIIVNELLARVRVHLANARLAFSARSALDATGRSLLAISEDGALLWCTPQAERLLAEIFEPGPVLPAAIGCALVQLRHGAGAFTTDVGACRAEFVYVSRTGPGELLFRVAAADAGGSEDVLKRAFMLTRREAEVLLWLSAGKSNRDISDILAISPRTVNKHLEQIFVKLGVENRASAAAMAVRAMAR